VNVEKFDCTFVIFGEPASKANSRKLVTLGGRPAFIKSQKARDYVTEFQRQCRNQIRVMTDRDVRVELMIHYASRRPDLDESVILDAMQGIVYVNDRQVKQRMAYWGLDKDMPRAVIRVVECDINDVPSHLVSTRVQDSVNK
jgi:Holliday junction resolvase RusA-like endonuclease